MDPEQGAFVRQLSRNVLGAGTVLMMILGMFAAVPPQSASAATWTSPRVDRVFSGPSRPGIAAWGLAYNPVTDEFAVGDYVSNQIRRYSRDGELLGEFANPKGNTEGVASAVAVDPRDGSAYVAVTGDGRTSRDVRKYNAAGQFLYDFDLPGSITWLTVDDQGYLWAPSAFGGTAVGKWVVNDATRSASRVLEIRSSGSGPGQFKRLTGIAVDGLGRPYVADPGNKRVHAFAADGSWRFDLGTDGLFPGDIRGVVVDQSAGVLYVANSQAGTIEVFDLDGSHLNTFSGLGAEDGKFIDGARQLTLTPDGHLWAADYGSRRVLEFAPTGAYLSKFPDPAQRPAPNGLTSPRGIAWDPTTGDIFTADPWAQRVQRFDDEGGLLRAFGQRGTFPPEGMNYPRSVGVDPATGNIWIVNYEGRPFTSVYDNDFTFLRTVATPRFPMDIEFVDGEAYMLVRRPGSVRVYDAATGEFKRECCSGLGRLRGIAVDPTNGDLWLTSDQTNDVYVLNSDGSRIATLKVDKRGWGVDIVGDIVYVADAGGNKVIAFDRVTRVRLGEFGGAGSAPGQMRGPSGITHDAQGRLYVVEERGSRVQRFTWDPLPPAETVDPQVAVSAYSSTTPIEVTGTASDASGVAIVEVAVQDQATGNYWNATATTWGSWTWNQAVLSGPLADAEWSFTLVPALPDRTYTVRYRARDVHGNISATRATTVSVSGGPVDDLGPELTVTNPSSGAGTTLPVVVTGQISDNTAVASVSVAVKDRANNLWWDPDAGVWGPFARFPAALDAPGGSTSTWSWPFAGAAEGGSYWLSVRGEDEAGNPEQASIGLTFDIAPSGPVDTTAPDTEFTSPVSGAVLPAGTIALVGTATDDTAVDRVQIAIRDRDSGNWWDPGSSSWQAQLSWFDAVLDNRGAAATGFGYDFDAGAGSRYWMQARAIDASGNIDSSKATLAVETAD